MLTRKLVYEENQVQGCRPSSSHVGNLTVSSNSYEKVKNVGSIHEEIKLRHTAQNSCNYSVPTLLSLCSQNGRK